jgi:cytochrome P450
MTTLHEAWKAVLTEGHKLEQDLLNLRELLDKDIEGLMAKPGLVKPLFTLLRKIRPIFVAPHIAAVSLYPDVLEVLGNEAAFSVVPVYAKKMEATTGDFVLGMGDTPQYQTEIGLMRSAVKPEDIDLIHKMVDELAQQQVDAAAARGGAMDAVGELSRFVPNRLVGAYFGAPGPDDATNMRWMRSIFREIFLNLSNDPNMAAEAAASSTEMNSYLDSLIAQRKSELAAETAVSDDFLCRLVNLQAVADPPFADEVIRRIVGGTTVGTVDTNSKAIAQALDQLLDRPLTLQDARNAAAADDDTLLAKIVFEALRFNPQNPFLLRRCEQEAVLAHGTSREAHIKIGTLMLVGTESAMFDPEVFPEPDAFRSDRPTENYIHFGHGQHTCFGQQLARVIIPGTLKPLLKRPGLRRSGGAGIQYDGAFPNRLSVEFDA